jgi:hypothetical protein
MTLQERNGDVGDNSARPVTRKWRKCMGGQVLIRPLTFPFRQGRTLPSRAQLASDWYPSAVVVYVHR